MVKQLAHGVGGCLIGTSDRLLRARRGHVQKGLWLGLCFPCFRAGGDWLVGVSGGLGTSNISGLALVVLCHPIFTDISYFRVVVPTPRYKNITSPYIVQVSLDNFRYVRWVCASCISSSWTSSIIFDQTYQKFGVPGEQAQTIRRISNPTNNQEPHLLTRKQPAAPELSTYSLRFHSTYSREGVTFYSPALEIYNESCNQTFISRHPTVPIISTIPFHQIYPKLIPEQLKYTTYITELELPELPTRTALQSAAKWCIGYQTVEEIVGKLIYMIGAYDLAIYVQNRMPLLDRQWASLNGRHEAN